MEAKLLAELTALYEKQDALSKITNGDLFQVYGNSEIHCIDVIGDLGEANGTQVAERLKITRSAVSKIIRRLKQEDLVFQRQKADNKKEIFYAMTEKGRNIYAAHKLAHQRWQARDAAFLKKIPSAQKEAVYLFLTKFNAYLRSAIEENKNDH